MMSKRGTWATRFRRDDIGILAGHCLRLTVQTWPKPRLVSYVDRDPHHDMDGAMLARSASMLAPFFTDMAAAGASGAGMGRLRTIGIAAERATLSVTGGAHTHRGAIFGLGLLCAAQGVREANGIDRTLGQIVALRWARGILSGPIILHSHGTYAARRYGAGGVRVQAARAFRQSMQSDSPAS